MRMLIAAAVVLAIAVGDFVVRGRGYLATEEAALAALAERVDRVAAMQRELPVVSRAEHDATSRERDAWVEAITRRRAELTDPDLSLVVPALSVQLDSTRMPGLLPGDAPRATIESAASRSALVEAVLTRVLDVVTRAGVARLDELTLLGSGRFEPIPGVDGLADLDLQLVVHGDASSVFTCLEGLVPGATRPLLGIRTATVQRVPRERWVSLPVDRMDGPPLRLTATVTAVFPSQQAGGDG